MINLLSSLKRRKLGRILHGERKRLDLRLEDLEDGSISKATISNIENGSQQVTEKMIHILCNKLKFDLDGFKNEKIQETEEDIRHEENGVLIYVIENTVRVNEHEQALKLIKRLEIKDSDPLAGYMYYLKAKCFSLKGNITRANKLFEQAISLTEQYNTHENNVVSSSYNEISLIYYHSNNIPQALEYIEKAINSFNHEGDRQYLKHALYINKAMFLEQLDKREEARHVLQIVWKEKDKISSTDTFLNMHDIEAKLLIKSKLYQDAITLLKNSLEIAIHNRKQSRAGALWATLGSAYKKTNKLNIAITCLNTSLDLLKREKKEHLFLDIYKTLGELYFQHGNIEKAKDVLEEGIKQHRKENTNVIRYSQTLIILAKCYYHYKIKNLHKKPLKKH